MKVRTKSCIAIIGLAILCAWTAKQTNGIKKAEWLIGTWKYKTSRAPIYETWRKTSENELSGKSYMIKEKDTIVFENIRLIQEQSGAFYVPTVQNQNEGLPIRFATKTMSETQLVFENLKHDFPQIISYTKVTSDSLVAEISGTKNGQKQKQIFPMKRIQ